jgi:ankyrin repeat protein
MTAQSNKSMDVRAKQRPCFNGLWFPRRCAAAVSPHVISAVRPLLFDMTRELLQAIENDDSQKVRELLASGIDLNFEDDDGDFPLYVASWRGNKEIVELLLANGADVNYEADAYFYTALMVASGSGHADIANLLLENGANVNAEDDWQLTSLMRAAESGHLEVARVLLQHGANASLRDDRGKTALELAEESGHFEVTEFIRRNTKPNGA